MANVNFVGSPFQVYGHKEDIRAAIAYGAEMARERYVEIPIEEPA